MYFCKNHKTEDLFVYSFFLSIVFEWLRFLALFKPKLKLFINGRLQTAVFLKNFVPSHQYVVFHCASLGEFEQGLPLMEAWKKNFNHQIIVTFFSPSGYEIKKNHPVADHVLYLPWDTNKELNLFLKKIKPSYVFLIKYEFWPNFLYQLSLNNIPVFVVSAIFRPSQIFFKPYGFWMQRFLRKINYYFVQNQSSKVLLNNLNIHNVMVSGDTRFDRVWYLLTNQKSLDFIKQFKTQKRLIVLGSTWPKDEELWLPIINNAKNDYKFVIVPHNINRVKINELQQNLQAPSVLYSEARAKNFENVNDFDVLIIDTIGLLTKIYADATMAYVGGGFGLPGIHNVLEPAVYGIPVIVGPNYSQFQEAVALYQKGGLMSVKNQEELIAVLEVLKPIKNHQRVGSIAANFVAENQGATNKIIEFFKP